MTEINNKPLISVTVEEFLEAAFEKFGINPEAFLEKGAEAKRNLVYGLKGLAKLLGCSQSTAARIKKSGVLDPAISQHEKLIVIDADLALDLLRVRKANRRGFNINI